MEKKQISKQRHRWKVAAFGLLMGAFALQGCQDDLLTGQPEWLGNSIYERLEEDGNYTTMLRLIDDLGKKKCSAIPARRLCLPPTTRLFSNGSPTTTGA